MQGPPNLLAYNACMRILALLGDHWHPSDVAKTALASQDPGLFEFDWLDDASDWSRERLDASDITILAKSNHTSSADTTPWMSERIEQCLVDHVLRGNGLLVLHSGTAGYDKCPQLKMLIGGAFLEHPEQCPVTIEPTSTHPITNSCDAFVAVDEHYFVALEDQQSNVFLSTVSEHGTQPGGWIRTPGNGRVCVLTPGHTDETMQHPVYKRLIGNALMWCGKVIS